MARVSRFLSPICLAATLALIAPRAAAQSEEDRAAARSLATQGIAAYNEGRHAEALDLFTRAESLLHAPPHVLYMARAAAKVGQLVRARELYLKLGREELPAAAPQAFRDAQAQAREEVKIIEPRLASLTIRLKSTPGMDPANVKVEIDGKPISSAVIGVAFPADPGKHRLTATAPGYKSTPVDVELAEGGRGSAELKFEATSIAATAAPGSSSQPQTTQGTAAMTTAPTAATTSAPGASVDNGAPSWMRPVSYVAMGVGVLGIGAGTYFGLKSRSTRKDADELANQCGSDCRTSDPLAAEIDSKDDSARQQMTLSIVGFVLGGVGAATGVTLFVLSSRERQASARMLSPYVGLGGAGIRGTW